jgi:murein endopeptidase
VLHRRPDRPWRRWGTDRLVRLLLTVVHEYARAHPDAPRVGLGDLSRPHGGPFGPKHATHQNGLDADVYYPRLDRRERPPKVVSQIDRPLAQDLVDRFVASGAALVYVGPATGLTGPPGVVQVLWNHDNHLHVRIAATTG